MNLLKYIFLGIIQGLTEFLPVSSSGHLVIFQKILNINEPGIIFEIIVHIGTLIAVVVYFRKDIIRLISAMFCWKKDRSREVRSSQMLVFYLFIATAVTGVIGILFKDKLEAVFDKLYLVGIMLLVTGSILFFSDRVKDGKRGKLSFLIAIIIGVAQSIAILPGISRSGTTITVGIYSGLKRQLATRFSFLLSIPAILGAAIFKIKDFGASGASEKFIPYFLALIASAAVGYFAIALMIRLINKAKLKYFSFYCWIIGFIVILVEIF